MASLVLGVAGAAVGFVIGGPAGASLGFNIGSTLGGLINQPNTKTIGPRINELKLQNSEYGVLIPILFGRRKVSGNVVWTSPLIETEKKTKSGKGGGKTTSLTYSYSVNIAVGFFFEETKVLKRLWADTVVIYDSINVLPPNFTVYLGTETQAPDSTIQTWEGVANTPAYRGLSYIVLKDFVIDNYGKRVPSFFAEFESKDTDVNGTETLTSCVNRISLLAGLVLSDIDTTNLSGTTLGYTISAEGAAKDFILPLASTYGFDVIESDNKVKFVTRTGATTETINFGEVVIDGTR